jgi:hypothetical protein
MPEEPFLAWLIVIGRYKQRAIDTEFLSRLRVGHRVLGGI